GAAALAGATRLAGRSGPGGGSRPRWPWVAAAGWLLGTAEFAAARIAPGPRTPGEVARMLVSSAAIPPVAVAYRLGGELAHRRARPTPAESVESVEPVEPAASVGSVPPLAVLFDRDGTLIDDVPYNGDPELVRPLPGALAALTRLRAGGVPVGVVTNQSAVGRGLLTAADVARVNSRVEELLGPFDSWQVCPHAPGDGCGCRKPAPGLVLAAAAELGVPPQRCVLVGDIGADLAAARAAGARAVLVPTAVTRPEEVAAAAAVAPDLPAAVELALAGGAR
ncbi:MAG: D-glycero-alpha-D-manno-heptose-1,7-bisphosphate 7-phosphatase, partial [Mycobacteriales bacterium]